MKVWLDNQEMIVEKPVSVMTLINERKDKEKIYAVIQNGVLHDLSYQIQMEDKLSFIYDDSDTGKLIYERSLHFLFIAAVKLLYPHAKVYLEHALSGGIFCRIQKTSSLRVEEIQQIEHQMQELVRVNCPLKRSVVPTSRAVQFFEQKGMLDKANLLRCRKSKTSSIYELHGIFDYFYGIMLPHTAYLTHFTLQFYEGGVWLSAQPQFHEQPKLFHVFQEFEAWGDLIGVSDIAQLNDAIQQGRMDELVLMNEAMAERGLQTIADDIVKHHQGIRFILVAGPSSAGKTTFSHRLAIQLRILGKIPKLVSMDDFYKNRVDCPRTIDGAYDFECLEALDLPLFEHTMQKLLQKEKVAFPLFNFKTGCRQWHPVPYTLQDDELLIIEGIHGLHPRTSSELPASACYKIYINALTHLNLDAHNRIPTSDYRLIRRLARDYHTRGWNAAETIGLWKNVKAGEDAYIYPYQEEADSIFNSSLVYELSILKKIVIPMLMKIPKQDPTYLEAHRLEKLLDYFVEGEAAAVPRSSIFAEFLGTSIFHVG